MIIPVKQNSSDTSRISKALSNKALKPKQHIIADVIERKKLKLTGADQTILCKPPLSEESRPTPLKEQEMPDGSPLHGILNHDMSCRNKPDGEHNREVSPRRERKLFLDN